MNSEVIVLLSTVCTGILALVGLCIRYCYLSKCLKVSCCWGYYTHERNIEAEMKQTTTNSLNNSSISNLNNIV